MCSSPRTIVNNPQADNPKGSGTNKGDEYDVLGRKKYIRYSTSFVDPIFIDMKFRPKTPRTPMSWDPEDDILLKDLKEEQRLGWKEIATHCECWASLFHYPC